MRIRIYQIDFMNDSKRVCFEGLNSLKRIQGTDEVDPEIYEVVYEGEVPCKNLEDVFTMFNIDLPDDYYARSMSVSDVVEIVDENTFYFCDSYGWAEINFDSSKANLNQKKIKVVLCEPNQEAKIIEIDSSLNSFQKIVDGYIETFYPFDENICIICNEEGKFNGNLPCRVIKDDEGNIIDIIYGTFFICTEGEEDFESLSDEQANYYKKKFLNYFI